MYDTRIPQGLKFAFIRFPFNSLFNDDTGVIHNGISSRAIAINDNEGGCRRRHLNMTRKLPENKQVRKENQDQTTHM
jgi:hypothetical protein